MEQESDVHWMIRMMAVEKACMSRGRNIWGTAEMPLVVPKIVAIARMWDRVYPWTKKAILLNTRPS